jgi:hypothetical protein
MTKNNDRGYNVANDEIPLVTYARTADTAWNLYIGGTVQVRETNAGLVQVRTGDETDWTTVGTKEVYA